MQIREVKAISVDVRGWIAEAADNIKTKISQQLVVEQKSGPKDLVTNMDKETEHLLIGKIRKAYPKAHILGEEGSGDVIDNLGGLVFIVDPIDGTMNFVKQKDNFAIMIGVYLDGQGILGFILDVMKDHLFWGGPELGVFCNDIKISAPEDKPLASGLLGVNGPMFSNNRMHVKDFVEISTGARLIGSAGVEYIQVMTGKEVGYISYLAPWDVAAGKVLAETLGLSVTKIDGTPVDLLSHEVTLIATQKVKAEIANYSK